MSGNDRANANGREVVVVIGATSKWQADGPNTRLIHGGAVVDDADVPVSARWGASAMIDPARIADAFFWLHTQDPCCWTHELQLTPAPRPPAV
jgi:hypothetical protein